MSEQFSSHQDRDSKCVPKSRKPIAQRLGSYSKVDVDPTALNDLRARLLANPGALTEGIVAASLILRPYMAGERAIARWAGVHKEVLGDLVGSTGGLSKAGYIKTEDRGFASIDETERRRMQLTYVRMYASRAGSEGSRGATSGNRHSSAHHSSTSSLGTPNYDQEVRVPLGTPCDGLKDDALTNGRISAGVESELSAGAREGLAKAHRYLVENIGEDRILSSYGQRLKVIDPSLDCFAEMTTDRTDQMYGLRHGKQVWRLMILFMAEDVELTCRDIQLLCGLSERGARNLVAEVTKRDAGVFLDMGKKVGRSKVYDVPLAKLFQIGGDWWETWLQNHDLRDARALADKEASSQVARRGTPAGIIAYRAFGRKTREEFLDDLPQDCDPEWRRIVQEGTEEEAYAHLVAKEAEAEAVPASPEALGAPQEPVLPVVAQESQQSRPSRVLGYQAPDPAKLAAMAARIGRIGTRAATTV